MLEFLSPSASTKKRGAGPQQWGHNDLSAQPCACRWPCTYEIPLATGKGEGKKAYNECKENSCSSLNISPSHCELVHISLRAWELLESRLLRNTMAEQSLATVAWFFFFFF